MNLTEIAVFAVRYDNSDQTFNINYPEQNNLNTILSNTITNNIENDMRRFENTYSSIDFENLTTIVNNLYENIINEIDDNLKNIIEEDKIKIINLNYNSYCNKQCCICFDDFDEKTGGHLKCKHGYHNECLHTWREKTYTTNHKMHGLCPYCRQKMEF